MTTIVFGEQSHLMKFIEENSNIEVLNIEEDLTIIEHEGILFCSFSPQRKLARAKFRGSAGDFSNSKLYGSLIFAMSEKASLSPT